MTQINIKIPDDIYAKVKIRAIEEKLQVKQIIPKILQKYVETPLK